MKVHRLISFKIAGTQLDSLTKRQDVNDLTMGICAR